MKEPSIFGIPHSDGLVQWSLKSQVLWVEICRPVKNIVVIIISQGKCRYFSGTFSKQKWFIWGFGKRRNTQVTQICGPAESGGKKDQLPYAYFKTMVYEITLCTWCKYVNYIYIFIWCVNTWYRIDVKYDLIYISFFDI